MGDFRKRLTDEELSGTEEELRASLSLLQSSPDGAPVDPLLESAIDIGLNLIDAVRNERKLLQYPVRSEVEDENAALKELIGALIPVAQAAEGLWTEMSQNDLRYLDLPTRHRVMSKLGGALRELRMVMSSLEQQRLGGAPLRNVA